LKSPLLGPGGAGGSVDDEIPAELGKLGIDNGVEVLLVIPGGAGGNDEIDETAEGLGGTELAETAEGPESTELDTNGLVLVVEAAATDGGAGGGRLGLKGVKLSTALGIAVDGSAGGGGRIDEGPMTSELGDKGDAIVEKGGGATKVDTKSAKELDGLEVGAKTLLLESTKPNDGDNATEAITEVKGLDVGVKTSLLEAEADDKDNTDVEAMTELTGLVLARL
jgi:hypothetical protein